MAWDLEVLSIVEWALRRVLEDLRRTSALRPEVGVDNYGNGVRITVDDGYSEPSVRAGPERQILLYEVTDYLQDQLMSGYLTVWPTCPTHPAGLHAELVNGIACWTCRLGGHTVALVGELPPWPPTDA